MKIGRRGTSIERVQKGATNPPTRRGGNAC